MIRLFTSWYDEKESSRRAELLNCLVRNLAEQQLDQVCVFLEQTHCPITDPKLVTRPISERPKYSDFFTWVNEVQKCDDIAIIANSDIWLDASIGALSCVLKEDQCAALTRWDMSGSEFSLFDRNDSQDAWVFRGPIRTVFDDFLIGVPRCDNRILHELLLSGYDVINPAFSIRCHHLHDAPNRTFADDPRCVPPPYSYIWPHNLMSLPRYLWHNFRHSECAVRWQFDRRRFASLLRLHCFKKLFSRSS